MRKSKNSWVFLVVAIVINCGAAVNVLAVGQWSYEGNVLPQDATPAWTKTAESGSGSYSETVGASLLSYKASGHYCYLNYKLSNPEYWREALGTYCCDFRTYSYGGKRYQGHQDYRFNIGTNQFHFEIYSPAGFESSIFPPGTICLLNQATNTEGYGADWHTYRFEYRVAAQQACLSIVDDPNNPVTIFTNLGPSAIVAASNYVQFGRIDDWRVSMYGYVDFLSFNQGTNVLASSMGLGGFADEFETGGSTGNNLYFLSNVAGSQSPALDVLFACDQAGNTKNYRGGASFTLNEALPDGLYQLAMQVQSVNIKKKNSGVPPTDRNGYFAYLIEATGNGVYNGVINGNSGLVGVYPQYNDSSVGGAKPPWKNFALAGWASPGFVYGCPSPVYLSGIDGVTSKLRVYVDDAVWQNYGFLTVESFDILDTSATKDLSLVLVGGTGGTGGQPSPEEVAINAPFLDQLPANGTLINLTYNPHYPGYYIDSMTGTNYVAGDFTNDIQAIQNAGLKNMTRNYARIMISFITADWRDDTAWEVIANNVRLGANAALQCGAAGFGLDLEDVGPFCYANQSEEFQTATMFDECAALVRERGRQFMDAINAGFPNARIFLFYATSKALGANPKEPMSLRWLSLLPAFIDGMMDAGPNNEFIDGYEQSYYFTNAASFAVAQSNILIDAAGLSADPARYQERMKVGFGIFPYQIGGGQFALSTNEALNNISSAQLADVLQAAYDYGDGFVWLYAMPWRFTNLPPAYAEVVRDFLINHERRPVRTVEIGDWPAPATPNEALKYYAKKMWISPCSGSATNWWYGGDYVTVAAIDGNPKSGVGGAAFRPVINETLPDGYYQLVADICHVNIKKANTGFPPADRNGSLSYRLCLAPGAAGTLSFANASSGLITYYPTNADCSGNTPYRNGPVGLTDFVAYGIDAWTSGGVGYIRLQGGVNATNLIFEFYDNVSGKYGMVGLKSFQLVPALKYYAKNMQISPCSGSAANWWYDDDSGYVTLAIDNDGNIKNGVGGAAFRPVINETLPDGNYQIVADIYHANIKKANSGSPPADPPADRNGSLSYRLSLVPGAAGTLSFINASSGLIDYYPTNADCTRHMWYYNGPIALTDFVAYGIDAWTSDGVGYIRLQGGVNAANLIFEFYDNVMQNYGFVGLKSFQLLPL